MKINIKQLRTYNVISWYEHKIFGHGYHISLYNIKPQYLHLYPSGKLVGDLPPMDSMNYMDIINIHRCDIETFYKFTIIHNYHTNNKKTICSKFIYNRIKISEILLKHGYNVQKYNLQFIDDYINNNNPISTICSFLHMSIVNFRCWMDSLKSKILLKN